MPRVDAGQRSIRDDRVLDLWLGGASYRAIGARRDVGLSVRGVHVALGRALAARGPAALLQLYGQAYQRAVDGDVSAQQRCRRLLSALDTCGVPPPIPASHEP